MSRRGDREQGGVISIQGGHNNLMLSPTREAPLTGSREAPLKATHREQGEQ